MLETMGDGVRMVSTVLMECREKEEMLALGVHLDDQVLVLKQVNKACQLAMVFLEELEG